MARLFVLFAQVIQNIQFILEWIAIFPTLRFLLIDIWAINEFL